MAPTDGAAARAARTWGDINGYKVAFSRGDTDPALPTAAFDFDSTLHHFRGRGPDDGMTRSFLAGLSHAFNIVIISNRSKTATMAPLRQYVERLDAHPAAGRRATVYASLDHDIYRKPHTGAWQHFLSLLAGAGTDAGAGAPYAKFAVFCGDAAGRRKGDGHLKNDHSADDYAFAHNNGLVFTTPERLFGSGDPWAAPESYGCKLAPGVVDEVIAAGENVAAPAPPLDRILELAPAGARIIAIMVGSPASGKSTLALQLVAEGGFALVCRDVHHTRFQSALAETLTKSSHHVVVDNTHPDAASRAQSMDLVRAWHSGAERAGKKPPPVMIVFCHATTPQVTSAHLAAARLQLGGPYIPRIAHRLYWKKFQPPVASEVDKRFTTATIRIPFRLAPEMAEVPEIVRFRY
jgi:DNA 3'-phosphatase